MHLVTLPYGPHPEQVGDLVLPATGAGPFPVVVVVHGGCWWGTYSRFLTLGLAAHLATHGIAAWNVEYRRLGHDGGGWPGTLHDIADAVDHLAVLAAHHPLRLDAVATVGHSAGGMLALWAAARTGLPTHAPGASPVVPVSRAVGIGAMSDLRACAERGVCRGAAVDAWGEPTDAATAARYAVASPVELLPLGVPTLLVHGELDDLVPVDLSTAFAQRAIAAGDDVTLHVVPGIRHFEPVQAGSASWQLVVDWLLAHFGASTT